MPLSANFKQVTLDQDASGGREVVVEGRHDPASDASEIFVAIPQGGKLRSVRVDAGNSTWRARVPAGPSSLRVGDSVFVVGVAMRPSSDEPFVWQQTLQIEKIE